MICRKVRGVFLYRVSDPCSPGEQLNLLHLWPGCSLLSPCGGQCKEPAGKGNVPLTRPFCCFFFHFIPLPDSPRELHDAPPALSTLSSDSLLQHGDMRAQHGTGALPCSCPGAAVPWAVIIGCNTAKKTYKHHISQLPPRGNSPHCTLCFVCRTPNSSPAQVVVTLQTHQKPPQL